MSNKHDLCVGHFTFYLPVVIVILSDLMNFQLEYAVHWSSAEICESLRKLMDHMQLDKVRGYMGHQG